MIFVVVGLGNPGERYVRTRHNTGRIVLDAFRKKNDFFEWKLDKKKKALVSEGKIKKEKIIMLMPETFMNNSGKSVAALVKSARAAERLVVIYDDLDLALGSFKISFNRGSGGHRGVESIARSLRTKSFIRIRIGISPTTSSGKIKKPTGEKAVNDFIVGTFKKSEFEALKKVSKKVGEALETIVLEGKEKAMSFFN